MCRLQRRLFQQNNVDPDGQFALIMLPRATASDSGIRPLFQSLAVAPFKVTGKKDMISIYSSSGMQDYLRPLQAKLTWSLDASGIVQ